MGEQAYRFVDFLQQAGQSYWQVLPLGPPADGNSPYSSFSAFAGNPLLIDLEALAESGLLDPTDLTEVKHDLGTAVDFERVRASKLPLLRKAFRNFRPETTPEFDSFCEQHDDWLHDFARFTALSMKWGHSDWSQWDPALTGRDPAALAACDEQLESELEFTKFLQFTFFTQWEQLKSYANERDVKIFGDMPIFVAYQSADVWANQDLFFLDEHGKQTVVAGVPPDYFSKTGQRWGNPLYRWDRLAETNYDWWIKRFRSAFENFDLIRIDHFRGFESYWEVPAECETAIDGRWRPGPGAAPFHAAREVLGELPIIAEDLGLITDAVHQLRDDLQFPGMRVFQFGFDDPEDAYHRPEAYPECAAVYTGTHDNETIMGWYRRRKSAGTEDALLDELIPPHSPYPHLDIMRAVFETPAVIAIAPMQDLLGLGNEARMNTPGEPAGNWKWRCPAGACDDELAKTLLQITESSHRRALVTAN